MSHWNWVHWSLDDCAGMGACRFVNEAALGEEFAFLLHLLHPLEHAERINKACDCDALVELVAHYGADSIHVLQLLLHLLLAFLTAHGHSELDDWERTMVLLECVVVAASGVQALALGVVGPVHGIFVTRKHLSNPARHSTRPLQPSLELETARRVRQETVCSCWSGRWSEFEFEQGGEVTYI
jgi:hypothetical protein